MIGLDTNVLVRYLVQDDPDQAARATRLIENNCTRESPGRIVLVVLCELVWVFRRAYGYEKRLILDVLDRMLVTAELEIESEEVARRALNAYRKGTADFSDYVIAYLNQVAGCDVTFSFDHRLVQHELVRLP